LTWSAALAEDVATIAAIADPFERDRALRAAIEVYRAGMARFSELRAETVAELLRTRTGRVEDLAEQLGVTRAWVYAVAAPNKGKGR
jgi:hypothetical protein